MCSNSFVFFTLRARALIDPGQVVALWPTAVVCINTFCFRLVSLQLIYVFFNGISVGNFKNFFTNLKKSISAPPHLHDNFGP